jgi:hypothetical protein
MRAARVAGLVVMVLQVATVEAAGLGGAALQRGGMRMMNPAGAICL